MIGAKEELAIVLGRAKAIEETRVGTVGPFPADTDELLLLSIITDARGPGLNSGGVSGTGRTGDLFSGLASRECPENEKGWLAGTITELSLPIEFLLLGALTVWLFETGGEFGEECSFRFDDFPPSSGLNKPLTI